MDLMNRKKVVLVTGLSGAGKTSAMGVLEDMGYYCVDRFPASLVDNFVEEILTEENPIYQHLALSVTAKDFYEFKRAFVNVGWELTVLFLDASYESLLLRYKYNRRNHPLLISRKANSLEESIQIEIEEFQALKDEATIIIDTSSTSIHELSTRIQRTFSISAKPILTISFLSFGYRYGLPRDADVVFDVRFLANPYWEEHLREMSGNQKPVYDYVIQDEDTQILLERMTQYLDYTFEQYKNENKHHLTIAIGCTGGQHRSVSIANWLYKYYQKEFTVFKNHRDIKDPEND